jgi:predicted DNA-binding transcriptional regulator YafY
MAKRPDALQTVMLVLELLKRIPRTRKVSARELHEQLPAHLARDLRTVQRQLDLLTQAFDIERDDSSRPYGYRWKERAPGLAIPRLSEQESLVLALAQAHLAALLPAHVMRSMSGFFAQAGRQLAVDAEAPRSAREWLRKVRVVDTTQPLLPPSIAPGVFESVSDALYWNRWLAIDYRNAAGERSQVRVMPLGLAQQGPRLYLVCRFEGYDNERSLALHRMRSATVMPHGFVRPREFRLDRYDEEGRFGFGEGRRIVLEFWIERGAGAHLLESPLAQDQTVQLVGDGYEVRGTVVESEHLRRWLRGFGSGVRVRSPKGLLDRRA